MKAKLNVKRRDGLVLAFFYAVVGISHLVILAMSNFALVTSAILAVLSLVAAFGLFTVKNWSVWLVIGLFFPQFIFGVVTLYASILTYTTYQGISIMLLNIALFVFIVFSFVSFVYIAAKRKNFR